MAKYKNYKTDSKKGIIGVIAAITASLLILGSAAGVMGYGTNGFKDWSFPNFSGKTKVEQVLEDDKEEKNGGAVITENETKGMRLMSSPIPREQYEEYGIMPTALTAQTITATITPEQTTNKKVNWSTEWDTISFSGGRYGSGIDNEVNSYITVAPIEEGSLQATVSCNAVFYCPIKITCTSVDNEAIKATATVNYVKKIKSTNNIYIQHIGDDIKPAITVEENTGSVAPDRVEANFTIRFDTMFAYEVKNLCDVDISKTVDIGSGSFTISSGTAPDWTSESLFTGLNLSSQDKEKVMQGIGKYVYGKSSAGMVFEIMMQDIKSYYKDVEIADSGSWTWSVYVNSFDDIIVKADGLNLNLQDIVFG